MCDPGVKPPVGLDEEIVKIPGGPGYADANGGSPSGPGTSPGGR